MRRLILFCMLLSCISCETPPKKKRKQPPVYDDSADKAIDEASPPKEIFIR